MSLEQSTAATINEIDRTLRSLGLREDAPNTVWTPQLPSVPLPASLASPARASVAAQTSAHARTTAGAQCCSLTRSISVQHSPSRKAVATQAGLFTSSDEDLRAVFEEASNAEVLFHGPNTLEKTLDAKVNELEAKLDRATNQVTRILNQRHQTKIQVEAMSIENQELTERLSLLMTEGTSFVSLLSNAHFQRARLLVVERESNKLDPSFSRCGNVDDSKLEDQSSLSDSCCVTPLDDLSELLGECRRVLSE